MNIEILEQLNNLSLEHIEKKIIQDQEKEKIGKYKHIKKCIDKNGVEYSVTEYVCPDGGIGFDIIFYKIIDGNEYIKIIGYGVEANSRSKDWTLIEIDG